MAFKKIIFLFSILFSSHSLAECDFFDKSVVSESIRVRLSSIARKNITKAKLRDGNYVPKETDAEKKREIIEAKWETCAIAAGFKSAQVEHCGMDYQKKVFEPFMKYLRRKSQASDKQSSYIGLLHGISLGIASKSLKDSKFSCSKNLKTELNSFKIK